MSPAGGFAFGPYRLDVRSRRLLRDDQWIPLPDRQFDLLYAFTKRAGELLPKDVLIEAAWHGVAVDDNTLSQAVSHLRRTLDAGNKDRYIRTAFDQGYRFVAPVEHVVVRHSDAELEAILVPHRAMMDGRAALETLEVDAIVRARAAFQSLLVHHADDERVQVGFANACVLQFESTRANPTPDVEALRLAAIHAREACRLDVNYGEAWATLGFVLERTGDHMDALAALRHSVTIEPDNWRHWLRLSFVSWGDERLRAARRTLALMPECPPARLLAATVFVARDALDLAERELDAGLAAMGADAANGSGAANRAGVASGEGAANRASAASGEGAANRASAANAANGEGAANRDRPANAANGRRSTPARFSMVGLHWLKALICLARDEDDRAIELLEKELALDARGHMYAREMAANAWYAMGAVRWRRGERELAREALEQAVVRVPGHPMARAALALVEGGAPDPRMPTTGSMTLRDAGPLTPRPQIDIPGPASPPPSSVDTAVARAISLARADDAPGAAALMADALAQAPPGNAGWLVPIEPLLNVRDNRAAWDVALATLRVRAS
jgi:DNA-binding winged helix-turn-helix (wHTH) protein/cytochrome c-type biogenesis protein CcmH/NrfG